LNEIITSGAKAGHCNGSSEFPWMADGVGLPSSAYELLPRLVRELLTIKINEFAFILKYDCLASDPAFIKILESLQRKSCPQGSLKFVLLCIIGVKYFHVGNRLLLSLNH